jgi:hypothetical protein
VASGPGVVRQVVHVCAAAKKTGEKQDAATDEQDPDDARQLVADGRVPEGAIRAAEERQRDLVARQGALKMPDRPWSPFGM